MCNKNNIVWLCAAFLVSLCLESCQKLTSEAGRNPILEVNGKFLYEDELESIISENISPEDSARLAETFVRKWVTNVLLYERAKKNVFEEAEIEKLVDEYRKSLTIHNYLQVLVKQRMPEPSDSDIIKFYDLHKDEFLLTETIVRGSFLKVPTTAPKLEKVRKSLKSGDIKSLEYLDKYTLQHAANYNYFVDTWTNFSEIQKNWPSGIENIKTFVEGSSFYETKDSAYVYMLKINDYRLANSVAPLKFAQDRIRGIVFNQKKMEYIRSVEDDIFNDAVENGVITFF